MSDQEQFEKDVGGEAHYWFTVSEVADLSIKHGMDKVIHDMLHYMSVKQKWKKE